MPDLGLSKGLEEMGIEVQLPVKFTRKGGRDDASGWEMGKEQEVLDEPMMGSPNPSDLTVSFPYPCHIVFRLSIGIHLITLL